MNGVQRLILLTVMAAVAVYGIVCMIGGNWSPTHWNIGGNIIAMVLLTIIFKNTLSNEHREEEDN